MPERVIYPPCPVGVACTGCRYCELAKLAAEAAAVPRRIQRRRTAGWRMPAGAVYVGRPTKWGNPWRVGDQDAVFRNGAGVAETFTGLALSRFQAVDLYRRATAEGVLAWSPQDLHELAGRDLACWCPLDQPCHADVLLELANGGGAP